MDTSASLFVEEYTGPKVNTSKRIDRDLDLILIDEECG